MYTNVVLYDVINNILSPNHDSLTIFQPDVSGHIPLHMTSAWLASDTTRSHHVHDSHVNNNKHAGVIPRKPRFRVVT